MMDAMMPGIDGFEACRRLKREKLLSHLPVIFMTVEAGSQTAIEAMQLGAFDYLAKPLSIGPLQALMQLAAVGIVARNDTAKALLAAFRFPFRN